MKYDQYTYLWPTRPTNAALPATLGFWEKRGMIAQIKKNGTNNVVFVTDKEVIFKTRHNDDHKQWVPKKSTIDFFASLPAWTVLNTELLHNKTKDIKDSVFIYDVVAYNGEQLVGETFMKRQELLRGLFDTQDETYSHYMIEDGIWLAKNYDKDFSDLYQKTLLHDEDEGLVLKKPKAKLKQCVSANSNSSWMIKCRKPHKNYSF